jgi:hypothetical protein
MEVLRHEAFRRGMNSGEREVTTFHRAFLKTVELFGRLYEPGLILINNVGSGHLAKDATAAPAMLLKGKLKLVPAGGADMKSLHRVFEHARDATKRGDV